MRRILAVDLGGTKVAVGLVDEEGSIIAREKARTPLGDAHATVELIIDLAHVVLEGAGPADALGLALPGVVDRGRGLLLRSPSSGWSEQAFATMIGGALGLESFCDNDVKACAWAERHFGAGRDLDSFFWLTLSTGIGGAIVAGGRVIEGAAAMAGEIGHLVVNPGGEVCGCGNRGCLEAEAAGPAWRRRALRLIDLHGRGGFLADHPRESLDAKLVADGARKGDGLCRAVVEEVAVMLARGIAAVYTILDPEAVFIGGGVAGALDLLLPPLRERLPSLAFAASARRTYLGPSELGYDAALVGAATLALFPY